MEGDGPLWTEVCGGCLVDPLGTFHLIIYDKASRALIQSNCLKEHKKVNLRNYFESISSTHDVV